MGAREMRGFGRRTLLLGVLGVAGLSGCEVTNPGPVSDEGLVAEPESQQALVTGAVRRMTELVGEGSYTMALIGREIFPGGQTGAAGHDVIIQGGHIPPETAGSSDESAAYWNDAQQARFIAETAIARFTEVGASDDLMWQAHIWAGYAYRVLGEWWCDAVIGGTNPEVDDQPGTFEEGTTTYFERAVANFTAALGYAANDNQRFAALAGRAAAHVWLGNWADAAADAAAVTDPTFAFRQPFDDDEQAYYNAIFWANAYTPYSSYSLDFTWYKDYAINTGDPRVPYIEDHPDNEFTVGSLDGFGQVPWSNQGKYTGRTSSMDLADYWEMRLIMAEAILQQGGAPADAIALINEVRTRAGVAMDAIPAGGDADAAWTALKRERAIELWLEGRRRPDERRWSTDGSGGTLGTEPPTPWEDLTPLFSANPRSYCFDIPAAERDANPNVPAATG